MSPICNITVATINLSDVPATDNARESRAFDSTLICIIYRLLHWQYGTITKGSLCCRQFKMHFCQWKCLNFDRIFTEKMSHRLSRTGISHYLNQCNQGDSLCMTSLGSSNQLAISHWCCEIYRIMRGLHSITFWLQIRRFSSQFHEWHDSKSLANRFTRDRYLIFRHSR